MCFCGVITSCDVTNHAVRIFRHCGAALTAAPRPPPRGGTSGGGFADGFLPSNDNYGSLIHDESSLFAPREGPSFACMFLPPARQPTSAASLAA